MFYPGRFSMSTKETDANCRLQHSTNVTEVMSFLGLSNILWLFVPIFARIAVLLYLKLKKDHRLRLGQLNETETEALETLQDRLISPPILSLSRLNGRYELDSGTCDKQIVCVLLQGHPKEPEIPVRYLSRSCTMLNRHTTQSMKDVSLFYGPFYAEPVSWKISDYYPNRLWRFMKDIEQNWLDRTAGEMSTTTIGIWLLLCSSD